MTPFILVMAITVNAIFEGIAFGLMRNMGQVMNLGFSLVFDKFAEAMAINVALQKS